MNQSQTRIHAYHSDPVVAAVIDTLRQRVAQPASPSPRSTTIERAAWDFFVLGEAMVAHPTLAEGNNLPREDFVLMEDGSAHYKGFLPPDYEGKTALTPEEYILLTAPAELRFPEAGQFKFPEDQEKLEEQLQPWVDAWKVEEGRLEAFLDTPLKSLA